MIRPLRRYHRRLIAAIVVTLTIAALLAIVHPAPDVRMETLPAPLLPAPLLPAPLLPAATDGPARGAAR
jgi:hypothetical protein